MEAAPSGGRKRQWQWRFPAPMASPALLPLLLPDPAAVKALTGMATCNVKSPAMSALSSRACHLSHMHEVASSTGASHVGYVQKKHPLGNISRRALFWEFVSKSTLNRDNCLTCMHSQPQIHKLYYSNTTKSDFSVENGKRKTKDVEHCGYRHLNTTPQGEIGAREE